LAGFGAEACGARWHQLCGEEGVTSPQQAQLVLAIFVVTQLLDGVLTYWGVSRFGVQLEFNSWLATLMTAIGPGTALIAAKGLACFCGFVLFATTSFRVLAIATGWCLGFAVVPWIALAIAFA
jgi:hypothetical protein